MPNGRVEPVKVAESWIALSLLRLAVSIPPARRAHARRVRWIMGCCSSLLAAGPLTPGPGPEDEIAAVLQLGVRIADAHRLSRGTRFAPEAQVWPRGQVHATRREWLRIRWHVTVNDTLEGQVRGGLASTSVLRVRDGLLLLWKRFHNVFHNESHPGHD